MHDPDIRGKAVALLLAGRSASQVSVELHVPRTTVIGWRDELSTTVGNSRPEKKANFADAVMQFASVAVYAMTSWADTLSDPDYQRAHDPDKLAIAFGVLGDKVAGLAASVEAMGRPGEAAAAFELPPSTATGYAG